MAGDVHQTSKDTTPRPLLAWVKTRDTLVGVGQNTVKTWLARCCRFSPLNVCGGMLSSAECWRRCLSKCSPRYAGT